LKENNILTGGHMNDYILKLIYKNKKPSRKSVGYLSAFTGAICNVLLFITKFIIGVAVNSISITADAFNNLSDLGTNLASFIGFKYADMPADKKHPFGHGRYEYISTLLISVIILLFSYELLRSSSARVLNPQPVEFEMIAVVILIISIFVKLWMAMFNKKLNTLISSKNIDAVLLDSIADILATATVLLSFILSRYSNFPFDGIAGILVALFIGFNGINLIKDTVNSLIGSRPDDKLYTDIQNFILSFDKIVGAHDLRIHDYGPETKLCTVHVEMSAQHSFVFAHTLIDSIENEIKDKYGIDLLIHVDPIDESCNATSFAKEKVEEILNNYESVKGIHDFRVVNERGRKAVVFDMVVDDKMKHADVEKMKERIEMDFYKIDKSYKLIIKTEKENTFVEM
jgi:cation diffusion facilitator family transporter